MSAYIEPLESVERRITRDQKCPFRIEHRSIGDNYREEMMPCDPKCAALLVNQKENAWSCLRLVTLHADMNNTHCACKIPER